MQPRRAATCRRDHVDLAPLTPARQPFPNCARSINEGASEIHGLLEPTRTRRSVDTRERWQIGTRHAGGRVPDAGGLRRRRSRPPDGRRAGAGVPGSAGAADQPDLGARGHRALRPRRRRRLGLRRGGGRGGHVDVPLRHGAPPRGRRPGGLRAQTDRQHRPRARRVPARPHQGRRAGRLVGAPPYVRRRCLAISFTSLSFLLLP
jgi:hypothetical protein